MVAHTDVAEKALGLLVVEAMEAAAAENLVAMLVVAVVVDTALGMMSMRSRVA